MPIASETWQSLPYVIARSKATWQSHKKGYLYFQNDIKEIAMLRSHKDGIAAFPSVTRNGHNNIKMLPSY